MPKYRQGKFKPRNPSKYMGDPTNIFYRSGWELKLMAYLDKHPKVLKWGSEELVIPYRSPIDGKVHRYFTDFIVKQINKSGETETIVIEVKPKKQTVEPAKKNTKSKRYIQEVMTWGVNKAKWEAAEDYCLNRGWKFQLMTEEDLF
jgi:hypothetical protein